MIPGSEYSTFFYMQTHASTHNTLTRAPRLLGVKLAVADSLLSQPEIEQISPSSTRLCNISLSTHLQVALGWMVQG